jgi:hypothetical protein
MQHLNPYNILDGLVSYPKPMTHMSSTKNEQCTIVQHLYATIRRIAVVCFHGKNKLREEISVDGEHCSSEMKSLTIFDTKCWF